jgi:hypothetical protein
MYSGKIAVLPGEGGIRSNNEKLFYKNLTDNKTQNNNGTPNINEIKEFW